MSARSGTSVPSNEEVTEPRPLFHSLGLCPQAPQVGSCHPTRTPSRTERVLGTPLAADCAGGPGASGAALHTGSGGSTLRVLDAEHNRRRRAALRSATVGVFDVDVGVSQKSQHRRNSAL